MARKTIEKNIAFDDVKNLYYVTMDYGEDDKGKRIKKTATFKTKQEAKKSLKEFEAGKIRQELVIPKKTTFHFGGKNINVLTSLFVRLYIIPIIEKIICLPFF